MKEIEGDLIALAKEGKFNLIIHGCNCQNVMGSGIAKSIRVEFPEAYKADLKTIKGDFNKLGNYTYADYRFLHSPKEPICFRILNCYTQYEYGTNKQNLDYEALTLCLRKINHNFPKRKIGLPKIGAGLGKGDWPTIKKIIEKELCDMDVTIVNFVSYGAENISFG